ncbi:MAG TPA: leucine-rich repeat-containing protein kinase family protein [Candidatus Saccharimonadia bacterium]|nr:leucine-rich repeat-containing protein kinase family protein [Candidatus Saccharimonadia bacterium]
MPLDTLHQLRSDNLRGAARLDLSCGLTELPSEVFDLADSLEILNLTGNALSSLPDDLPRLRKLRILFCSSNAFTSFPEIIGSCPRLRMVGFKSNQIEQVPENSLPSGLRWLILTDNRIKTLPDSLGRCTQMQKLMLSGNQLQKLPESCAAFEDLELLRLAANQFECLPSWLTSLPRLAWLAFAGNPISPAPDPESSPIAEIPWSTLKMGALLGEGASGRISQAQWQAPEGGARREVAVKVFKGAMTSDGLPENEMAAALAAGSHPNLVDVLGRVSDHPLGSHGLVMSLLDAGFVNLAGPPSFDSCTRDVYASGETFSVDTVHGIASSTASVASHLHEHGLMLGDLYAHNILHHPDGRCRITDFGGATFLPAGNNQMSEALERIEVRAFGILLEELLARCTAGAGDTRFVDTMRELQKECQGPPAERPLFKHVESVLKSIVS